MGSPDRPFLNNADLSKVKDSGSFEYKKHLANNIVTNARTIAAESGLTTEAFNQILHLFQQSPASAAARKFSGRQSSDQQTGEPAIGEAFAASIGSVARFCGWNMDSPQVIYMSSYLLLWSLGKAIDSKQEYLDNIRFADTVPQEKQEETKAKRKAEVDRLRQYYTQFAGGIDAMSNTLPVPDTMSKEDYLELLKRLLFVSRVHGYKYDDRGVEIRSAEFSEISNSVLRERVCEMVKTGRPSEALETLRTQTPPPGRRTNPS